jgi:hypothetical protein
MAYLRLYDYYQNIQSAQIDQLTGGSNAIRLGAELVALEEVTSYLTQKYDTAAEFTDTVVWAYATPYKAKNRVYLDATAYSAASTYALNALVLQAGNVYICTTAVSVAEAFNAAKWALLGAQYDLFYVTLPKTEFNEKTIYAVGDEVFWKDKTYTCVIATTVYTHSQKIQFGDYADIPARNVFPDNATNGVKYWGVGVAYSVAAGTLPTNTAKFTFGDNRSQKIVDCCIDISLYKMHSRIAPNNIPQLRIDNYDSAILWLKACGKGSVTAAVPTIQPKQGRMIRYGGNVKNTNHY